MWSVAVQHLQQALLCVHHQETQGHSIPLVQKASFALSKPGCAVALLAQPQSKAKKICIALESQQPKLYANSLDAGSPQTAQPSSPINPDHYNIDLNALVPLALISSKKSPPPNSAWAHRSQTDCHDSKWQGPPHSPQHLHQALRGCLSMYQVSDSAPSLAFSPTSRPTTEMEASLEHSRRSFCTAAQP